MLIILLPNDIDNDNDDNDDDDIAVFRHLLIVRYACVHSLCLIPSYVSAQVFFFGIGMMMINPVIMHQLLGGTESH